MIRDNYIYVVLVKAHTGLGKVARVLSGGYEYSHIAVCKEDSFEDFITFSRRRHYAPFDAGFMHETRDCYCFGTHDRVKLKIFRLPMDLRSRQNIDRFIRHVEQHQERYAFNLYSMITMPFFHGLLIAGTYNCMSFVGKIVELSGAVCLAKSYYQYSIRELDELLKPYLYMERYFEDKEIPATQGYMDKVSLWENVRMFLCLNGKLLRRMMRGGCNESSHI